MNSKIHLVRKGEQEKQEVSAQRVGYIHTYTHTHIFTHTYTFFLGFLTVSFLRGL